MLAGKTIEIREATTRYVNIPCKNRDTGEPFDFTGYDVQTWVAFGSIGQYVPTTVIDSLVSYPLILVKFWFVLQTEAQVFPACG